MRFIIYGAGGVGGVIGAQLFKGNREVVLIARGHHLEVLRDRGLHYQTPYEDQRLAIPAVGHPDEIDFRPDDVVILTCKSQHSTEVLDTLRRSAGVELAVVCCQNGVDNERMALRRFRQVYAMLVILPAQLLEPGQVQCHAKLKSGILDLGRYPGGTDARCEAIAEALEAVNFSVRPDGAVMRLKYTKLLMNLNNALEAVVTPEEGTAQLKTQMKAEGEACLRAAGIDWASDEEMAERRRGVFEFADIPGVGRAGGSSRQSLMRGTGDIEADYLNGEIARLGRIHGVPTPVNEVLQRLAVDLAARREAPASVPLDVVRAEIAKAQA